MNWVPPRIPRLAWVQALLVLSSFACTTTFPREMIPTDSGSPNCGNGTVDPAEECDGADLDGQTCEGLSYDGGELACTGACTFDTSSCLGQPLCEDGRCEAVKGESAADCPQDCAFTDIRGGEEHSCGVRADGSAWCWGSNTSGQLGTGDLAGSWVPVQVPDLPDISSVAAGWDLFSCAVSSTGTVWCWGNNSSGQLGVGDIDSRLDPNLVDGISGVDAISAGQAHVCVVKTDEAVWCWGDNDKGQLGIGTLDPTSAVPVQVTGLSNAIQVSAGKEHTCALDPNSDAWCWGHNNKYQLGTGDNQDSRLPVAVTGLPTSVYQISAGGKNTCAVLDDHSVWCWGDNDKGQLGIGDQTIVHVPVQVENLQEMDAVEAGEHFACALKSDGTVWCWGENGDGQLGDDALGASSFVPVQVTDLIDAQVLGQGKRHIFALTTAQRAWGWGLNDMGQLGDDSNTSRPAPVPVHD